MTEEIKAVARKHLAADGANLSLRAVARDMGMVSSALYRYFPSRDDLLTALILDAYNAMGEAAEAADAAVGHRGDITGRWLTVTHALRTWALDRPHEYALIYGTPVPGYAAPQDTIGPASRPVLVFGSILVDAEQTGKLARGPVPPIPRPLRAELKRIADVVAPGLDERTMALGLLAWTEVFGAISFELFGRIDNTIDERPAWFDLQMRVLLGVIGVQAVGR
jgi:AcrR family transcriptional regulator